MNAKNFRHCEHFGIHAYHEELADKDCMDYYAYFQYEFPQFYHVVVKDGEEIKRRGLRTKPSKDKVRNAKENWGL